MIHSKIHGLVIHGIGQQTAARYKAPDGTIKQGKWMVADGQGGGKQPGFVLGVTDTPYAVAYAVVGLTAAVTYDLSGQAVPAGAVVHLSAAGSCAPDALAAGEITTVQSDAEGMWRHNNMEGIGGTLYAWIRLDDVQSAPDASLTINAEAHTAPDARPYTLSDTHTITGLDFASSNYCELTYAYSCPEDVIKMEAYDVYQETCQECGGSGNIEGNCRACGGSGSVTGSETCPSCGGAGVVGDAVCPVCNGSGTLEISQPCPSCGGSGSGLDSCPACNGTGSVDVAEPVGGNNVAGGSGTDTIYLDLREPQATIRWACKTGDADGTLSITVQSAQTVCLSGDTLIAMADGSDKRLDALAVGDMVLGGDGRPARVLRLGRGVWNDRHTLYHFDDGTTIDETHEHRFYSIDQGFWQKLKAWRIGDRARRQDGSEVALVSVERIKERVEMFGLWVERGSYWAGGLLSGDASANQALLADATAEQAADMVLSLRERDLLKIVGLEGLMP